MRRSLFIALVLAMLLIAARPDEVDAAGVKVEHVEAELLAESSAVVPGRPLRLGLRLLHDPHWHTYWRNPGDSGLPTQLALTLPDGWRAGELQWPAPQRIAIGPLANFGYEGELLLPVTVEVPSGVPGREVVLRAHAQWLMCREVCIPGETALELRLPVAAPGEVPPPSAHAALFARTDRRLPTRTIATAVGVDGDTMSMSFDGADAAQGFFYPYGEGAIEAPAPQKLYRHDGRRLRLEARLGDGGRRLAGVEAARGIVVVDEAVFETEPAPGGLTQGGRLLATMAAAATAGGSSAGSWSGGGGLGGLLRGGTPSTGGADGGVSGGGIGVPPATADTSDGDAMTLGLAIVFGLVGGVILNLMPCVFPVIGLKVLAFAAKGSGGEPTPAHRRHARAGAVLFALGVLCAFWALVALLLVIRAGGETIGWGFQLQSPVTVSVLALLFLLVGLNFSGVFGIGASMTRLGQFEPRAPSLPGTFLSGVLAVVVATPCTAPFMGSALGFTLTEPPSSTILVFTAIGIGMALPYLLLGFFPGWLRWLPRPGRWMETLRQLLAFPMYATAIWLGWVLARQAGVDAMLALGIGAVVLAAGAWMFGRFVQDPTSRMVLPGLLVALLVSAAGVWIAWPGEPRADAARADGGAISAGPPSVSSGDDWQPWSVVEVESALAAGRPVFVDFTAAWCVSCQVNERLVLERDSVRALMRERRMVRLKADWTHRDSAITAELARHRRNGVPLYLLYIPGETAPRVLPELLTPGIVARALDAVPVSRLAKEARP